MKRQPKIRVLHDWDSVDFGKLANIYRELSWHWTRVGIPTRLQIAYVLSELRDKALPGNYVSTGGLGATGEGKVFFDQRIEALYGQSVVDKWPGVQYRLAANEDLSIHAHIRTYTENPDGKLTAYHAELEVDGRDLSDEAKNKLKTLLASQIPQ